MSYEPVDIFLVDTTPLATPIPGVVVKIYSQDRTQVFGQQLTDGTGKASFLLPSGVTYEVRFYKKQVNIKNPQLITVLEAPAVNAFTVQGEVFTPPTSLDPRLCICSGFFRTITGAPASNLDIHIISEFDPLLLEGDAVLTERAVARTDSKGYVQIPLIRNGRYKTTISGFDDNPRTITVPDALSANLPDLLFPVVASIQFNPPIPASIAVGTTFTTNPIVTASDGQVLSGTATGDVIWGTDNPALLAVQPSGPALNLLGLAPGSCNLTAQRMDNSIIRIPDTGIAGVPVPITVV